MPGLDKFEWPHHDGKVFPQMTIRICVGLAIWATLRMQAATLPTPADAGALLKELQGIEDQQKQSTRDRLSAFAKQLSDGSATAGASERIYLDALKDVSFDSKSGDSARFQDWKKNHKGMLENKAFQAALMLNLRYTAICLSVAANPDQLPPFTEMMDYLRDFIAARDQYGNGGLGGDADQIRKDFFQKPISEGVIAQGNFFAPDLQKLAGGTGRISKWETSPGEWQSILEVNIREPLRRMKDPRLLDTWQFQIDAASSSLQRNRGELDNSNFTQIQKPRLLWSQAQDMIVLDQKPRAIASMVQIIRTYPHHPDVIAWIAKVKELLNSGESTGPSATPDAAERK